MIEHAFARLAPVVPVHVPGEHSVAAAAWRRRKGVPGHVAAGVRHRRVVLGVASHGLDGGVHADARYGDARRRRPFGLGALPAGRGRGLTLLEDLLQAALVGQVNVIVAQRDKYADQPDQQERRRGDEDESGDRQAAVDLAEPFTHRS